MAEASGGAQNERGGAKEGIAEGTIMPSHGNYVLTSRILHEKATVTIQSYYRRYRAGVHYKVLKTMAEEARGDLEAGTSQLRGDLVREHERLVHVQDDAMDDSWASNSTTSAALHDPEEDEEGAEALQTAVKRLGDAVKARDLAAKKKAEQQRQEEAHHIARSINRYNEAAEQAQRSAQTAEERVKLLDAKIEEALHSRNKKSPVKTNANIPSCSSNIEVGELEAATDSSVPVPSAISTAPDRENSQRLEQLDIQEDISVEFSVGDPESLLGSSASSSYRLECSQY